MQILVPVANVLPGERPKVVSRQEVTATPVPVMIFAARNTAALPMAKGPRAVVHRAAFAARTAPV